MIGGCFRVMNDILGVYYLYKSQSFFAQTHRENFRDAIEQSDWLQKEMPTKLEI
jgi:hypothetical protein